MICVTAFSAGYSLHIALAEILQRIKGSFKYHKGYLGWNFVLKLFLCSQAWTQITPLSKGKGSTLPGKLLFYDILGWLTGSFQVMLDILISKITWVIIPWPNSCCVVSFCFWTGKETILTISLWSFSYHVK